jgi:hypothetical protein
MQRRVPLKGSNQRKRREEIQSEGHEKTMQSSELAQIVSIKVETELSRIYGTKKMPGLFYLILKIETTLSYGHVLFQVRSPLSASVA